jgi:rare lipoprotein A
VFAMFPFHQMGRQVGAICAVLSLAGCLSAPHPSAKIRAEKEVLALPPPADLEQVPDAQPKVEPIAPSGPNKPYEVSGQTYTPERTDRASVERGIASWYGKPFHGRRTANGEVYNMYAMTAAHRTMPLPSYAKVRNPKNGREIVVRVNDRGPFVGKRIIDLSYAAAMKLGIHNGIAPIEIERITHAQIRSGAWRTVAPAPILVAQNTDVAIGSPSDPVEATPTVAQSAPRKGIWLQLGVFKKREGAEEFHRSISEQADWLAPLLAVFNEATTFRLQAGPYADKTQALDAAQRIRDMLRLVPMLVQRR